MKQTASTVTKAIFFIILISFSCDRQEQAEEESVKDYSYIYNTYQGIHAAITTYDQDSNEVITPAFSFTVIIDEEHLVFYMDGEPMDTVPYAIVNETPSYILLEGMGSHNNKEYTYHVKYKHDDCSVILTNLLGGAEFELFPIEQ